MQHLTVSEALQVVVPTRTYHKQNWSMRIRYVRAGRYRGFKNLAKIDRQASDQYACALLEFLKFCSDLERTLEK